MFVQASIRLHGTVLPGSGKPRPGSRDTARHRVPVLLRAGGEGRRSAMEDDRARVCERCKQRVAWGEWRFSLGGDRGVQVREGHCGCEGKGYLQTRQRDKNTDQNGRPP